MDNDQKKGRRILLTALSCLAALLLSLLFSYRVWEKPPALADPVLKTQALPEITPAPPEPSGIAQQVIVIPGAPAEQPTPAAEPTPTEEPAPTEEPLPEGEAIPTTRQDGVYTILLVGNDDGNGNTDTILLGRIDTLKHEMDFVSIPRDTLINTSWRVRRINTVYWGARNGGADGIAALKMQVGRLTGFQPDCAAVIDLQVFMEAVDMIGGVYFDVPMAMDYEDAGQNLFIHLQPGYQLLDGYQAMCLCRFRSGYITGDLGRIEMQQQFLSACASQFLSLGNVPKARALVDLLSENLDTDLTGANMAYLLRQFLACGEGDIRFHLPPCDTGDFGGCSYVLLQVQPWLDLINSCLNPYETPIRWGNVDIVYRSGNGVACTGRLRDPDYYKPAPTPSSAPTEPPPTEPPPADDDGGSEAEIVSPSPGQEPTPEPEPDEGTPAIIVVEP